MAYSGPMTKVSGTQDKASPGDPIPPKCSVIEVHVGELRQLFNAIDPSPFRDKDLDPKAEEFIVGWAKDLPRDATLALVKYGYGSKNWRERRDSNPRPPA
jgi:hypothetical protein